MFIVALEVWNTEGSYEGEWVSNGSDPIYIDEPEEAVRAFVDSHNQVFINTAERELNARIASMQGEIDAAQFAVNAATALSAEQQNALGIQLSNLQSDHRMKTAAKQKLEDDLKRVQTDPFKQISRWDVPVKRQMTIEEVEVHKLRLTDDGLLVTVHIDNI